ncbi:EamA-like transporter family protein [Cohnella sp. CFH 77786]|uniref:DMT family transporter n=1 Tax=Cohnella sp. CFH 77786 TaxID=2662265 RepID=UPI001C608C23|nr:DMT family transporter [Cohnella sp. CFH 77786]MBW5447583.1 EamA-like transporter family protein [Cohnella sp. CFH 77786]
MIYVLSLLSGIVLSLQGSMNGALGKNIGFLESALVSFVIGLIGIAGTLLFWGNGQFSSVLHVEKWKLLGGLAGAFYIIVLAYSVPKIGVGASTILVFCGQAAMSVVIDHFGLLQSPRIPITSSKLIAIVLLIAAVYFFTRDNVHHNV